MRYTADDLSRGFVEIHVARITSNCAFRQIQAQSWDVDVTQKTLVTSLMVKKLEWIEMAQLAVSSIVFKSLLLKLP